MKNLKNLVLLACVLTMTSFLVPSKGAADTEGWQIDPAIMYLMTQQGNGSNSTTTSEFLGTLGVGYEFSSPIFLGALFDYDANSTTPGTNTTTYTNYGPTIGLMTSSFYFDVTYFLSSQDQNTVGSATTTYTGSGGFMLSLGYMFSAGSWEIGPQLSYKTMSFSTAGATTPINTLRPYLAFTFHI